eukprot:2574991-Prymnesium_polylepis.2
MAWRRAARLTQCLTRMIIRRPKSSAPSSRSNSTTRCGLEVGRPSRSASVSNPLRPPTTI